MKNRLLAIGDIHGCFKELKELVENRIQLSKEDKLVLLGDYIDRGEKSKAVVDYIRELQYNGYDVIALMGNHEWMLLQTMEDESYFSVWMYNGGGETLRSFKIGTPGDLDPDYIRFFRELPVWYEFEDYLFVHGGFDDQAADPFHDTYYMLWECPKSYSHPRLAGRTIVHGHRPLTPDQCARQVADEQVINLDTGCVYKQYPGYGRLTGVELHSKVIFSV